MSVDTMRNENSGVSPKLRTYAAIRAITLHKFTYTGTGGTLDLSSDTIAPADKTTGYWVAGTTQAHIIPLPSDVRPFQRALASVYTALQGTGYCGVWVSGGNAYVEGSQWVLDRHVATVIGRSRGQVAIFDIAANKNIYI